MKRLEIITEKGIMTGFRTTWCNFLSGLQEKELQVYNGLFYLSFFIIHLIQRANHFLHQTSKRLHAYTNLVQKCNLVRWCNILEAVFPKF